MAVDFARLGALAAGPLQAETIDIRKSDIDAAQSDPAASAYVDVFTAVEADKVPVTTQKDAQMLEMYPDVTHKFLTRQHYDGILPSMRVVDQNGVWYQVEASVSPAGATYNRIYVRQLPGQNGA